MYRKQISQKASPSVRSTPISKEIAPSPSYGSLSSVVQRVQQDPKSVSEDERQQLESAIGTRSTKEILAGKQTPWVPTFQGISAQLWGEAGQVGVPIQAKLTIGEVGDKYEQEADRVAKDVVQRIHAPQKPDLARTQPNTLQRQEIDEEELQRKELPEMVQRREAIAGGEASTDLASSINSARSGGQPLDASLQQSMGQAMGADFSGVRVHTGVQADRLNQSIQAKAFTTGQDVFFRQGEYQPGSKDGQELIAHELTHVVQQSSSVINRKSNQETVVNSDQSSQSEKIKKDAPVDVVQRRVGFEFEAQWNVRDVSDMNQSKIDLKNAQTARDKIIHIAIAKTLAAQPHVAKSGFGVKLSRQERDFNKQERLKLWFTDQNNTQLTIFGRNLIERVDHKKANEETSSYSSMLQSLYLNKTLREPPLLGANVPKGTAFINATKFNLTADSSPSGGSNLEWVTEPLTSKEEVSSVLDNIVRMASFLNSQKSAPFIRTEDVTVGGGDPTPHLRIYPDKKELIFAPQATVGLNIGKISDFIDYLEPKNTDNDEEKEQKKQARADLFGKGDFSTLKGANAGAKQKVDQLNIANIPENASKTELIGLVTLLANYLRMAHESMMNNDNSKAIAGTMMARTDFSHNYKLIPQAYQNYFKLHPNEFVALVLDAAGYPNSGNERIFTNTIEKGTVGNTQQITVTLTRQEWLENIPQGYDILKNYVNLSDEINSNPNNNTLTNLITQKQRDFEALHKSLGGLGTIDDMVGSENDQVRALVVELRRMKTELRVNELKEVALSTYELIERLNTGKELKYKP